MTCAEFIERLSAELGQLQDRSAQIVRLIDALAQEPSEERP